MRKIAFSSGLALAASFGVGIAIPWLAEHIRIKPIEYITLDEEDDESSLMNEHQEAEEHDKRVPSDVLQVQLHDIHFGDLSVPCPVCDTEVDVLHIGLSMLEDRNTQDGEFNDLLAIGVIVYPCGHAFHHPKLSDRVATILNAEELGRLSPSLFADLSDVYEG
jgi:hypothetical protein